MKTFSSHHAKRSVLAGAVLAALAFTPGLPAEAAYTLSSDVMTATPALLEATQIGVRTWETPELQHLDNKDAIVVTSFGTTFKETRAATIEATVKAIETAHPDVKVVTAFTSHIIRDRILENEGIRIPTPEEALERLKAEGYTRVAVTGLNIIPGIEYKYTTAVFNEYKHHFKKMTLGLPLMYWMGQEDQRDDIVDMLTALETQLPKRGEKDAVLIMAHGTPDPANAYYAVIQDRIDEAGLENVFLYTVEGEPRLEHLIPSLKEKGITHVTLMPLMTVAGDHASNDMSGDEKDSHKSILLSEGFEVDVYLHGLGENRAVRQLFVDRSHEAYEALVGMHHDRD